MGACCGVYYLTSTSVRTALQAYTSVLRPQASDLNQYPSVSHYAAARSDGTEMLCGCVRLTHLPNSLCDLML